MFRKFQALIHGLHELRQPLLDVQTSEWKMSVDKELQTSSL